MVSEIHYNPAPGNDSLEFVELANDTSTPQDLSGYAFVEGIRFVFPPGTILDARAHIVVCADVDALVERYDIENAVGNFEGRLDSGGDRLTLVNHAGVVVQSLRFKDRDKWPTGPDGSGHTLALRNVHLDTSEPESWVQSDELGGTPGTVNFLPPDEIQFEDVDIVPVGAEWRLRRGDSAFSDPPTEWTEPEFDDAAWEPAVTGIGYGDDDDATVLDDMRENYTSIACRVDFVLPPEAGAGDLFLGVDYDDGFCAYLNGVEVARRNCPDAVAWNETASGSREAGEEEFFPLSSELVRDGTNVLAIVAFNFSIGSGDFSLIPRVVERRPIGGPSAPLGSILFSELFRGSNGDGWVEIENTGRAAVSLGEFRIEEPSSGADPFVLPAVTLAPGEFFVVEEATSGLALSAAEVKLFLFNPSGVVVAATIFERAPPFGGAIGEYSEARLDPDDRPRWVTLTPTPGAPNVVERTTDVVINEIYYHPPDDRNGEFLELYNRGSVAIDLSGFRFSKGIELTFADGTTLPAGGYIVVAEDPQILADRYGYQGAYGPYEGSLADGGENVRLVDRSGNLVDEVRYFDGGRWSEWADGRGASLELIDPRQDNDVASAWDASDESEKADWEKLEFFVSNYAPTADTELHLFLSERGTCHIDDVSITPDGGGENRIPNPGFESSTTPWVIQGTHVRSRRVTDDSHSGNACLRIDASAKGDSLCNRIETDTRPRLARGAYDVSLWARWIRGSSLLIAHGEFTPGPWPGRPAPAENLSGNTLAARLRLTVPWNLGTPGSENSVTRRLREESGAANLGPVISDVSHAPVSPAAGVPTIVTARVSDADGIESVKVYYRENDRAGTFSESIDLRDDGVRGDGAAGDGVFGGSLPGFDRNRRVVYYVEAVDSSGALRRFPVDAPERVCLFQAAGPETDRLDVYRVILDATSDTELRTRPLHSNDLVDGAFVFDDEEATYNIGLRYRGSPWGRPGRTNFRVRFPDDDRFHRGRKAINLSSRGANAREGVAYFLAGRANGPHAPAPTADYHYIRTHFNGNSLGTHAMIQPVDGDYIEKWYGDEAVDEAIVIKAVGRLAFNDVCARSHWDGASFWHMDEEAENYRGYWTHTIHKSRDRWDEWIELTRVMDRRVTRDAEFDARVGDVLDLDAYLRMLAVRILTSDWDAVFVGNGHNGYCVYDPTDGKWELLPFDMDNSMGNPNAGFFPTGDVHAARLLSRPEPRRVYFRALEQYTDGYWSVDAAGPWMDAVTRSTGVNASSFKGYINTVKSRVESLVRSSATASFRIRSGDGETLVTEERDVEIEGEAPLRVEQIYVEVDGGDTELISPVWSSVTRWSFEFPTTRELHELRFFGFDGYGEFVGELSLTVRSSRVPDPPTLETWSPDSGPAEGGTEVTFVGTGFGENLSIRFGGVEATSIDVRSPELAVAVSPPAPDDLPENGRVDLRLAVEEASVVAFGGFTYERVLFIRGDANRDGGLNIGDPIATLFYLFADGSIVCEDAADTDDDGGIDISDPIRSLNYLFGTGDPPAAPFPHPGADVTPDDLDC